LSIRAFYTVYVVSIRCDIIFRCFLFRSNVNSKKCNSFAIHPRGGLQLSFFLSFLPHKCFYSPCTVQIKCQNQWRLKHEKVSVCVEKTRKDLLKIYFVELRKTACKCSILLNLRIHVKLFFFSISSFSCLKDESSI